MKTVNLEFETKKQFERNMQDATFKEWYSTKIKSEPIKNLLRKYPFETYKVKEGAPYSVSCPGQIVHLYSFLKTPKGTEWVSVVILAEEKTLDCLKRETELFEKYQPKGKTLEDIHATNTIVNIEPKWLEPIIPDVKELENAK